MPATTRIGARGTSSAEDDLKHVLPDRHARQAVLALALRLRRQQDASLKSARTLATTAALVLRAVVRTHPAAASSTSTSAVDELVVALQTVGDVLQRSAKTEPIVSNTVRRIITIIREEAASAADNGVGALSVMTSSTAAAGATGATSSVGHGRAQLTPQKALTGTVLSRLSSATTSPASFSRRASAAQAQGTFSPTTGAASMLASPSESQPPSLATPASTTSSAPGTGASTPYHASHQGHAHPARPGLSSLPSAFGSFSISDLVSVGSTQGGPSGLPSSRLAMNSLSFSEGAGSIGGDSTGALTPDRSISNGRGASLARSPVKDAEVTEAPNDNQPSVESKTDDRTDEIDASDDDAEEKEDDDAEYDGGVGIKPLLLQAIQEYIDEIDSVPSSIAKDARDHIHSGETILTLGRSRTIEAFLKAAAAKERHFTVIVPEGAPDFDGHHFARTLSHLLPNSNPVLLIPDSAVHALMPRVSKVLLGAHAILPNGGILTRARGAGLASLAASEMRTPVVVLAGVFKVCPDWTAMGASGDGGPAPTSVLGAALTPRRASYDFGATGAFSPMGSIGVPTGLDSSVHLASGLGAKFGHKPSTGAGLAPSRANKPYAMPPMCPDVLLPRNSDILDSPVVWAHAEPFTPEWEYIDPSRIDVLITNVGEHPPSYVYRLVKENYHLEE